MDAHRVLRQRAARAFRGLARCRCRYCLVDYVQAAEQAQEADRALIGAWVPQYHLDAVEALISSPSNS
ncbi:hypothetical protein LJ737_04385 [Hymenobacter sp. 15J16-1T3B]|nr:hypothetical protein [Hymenobacter sp. 15J16-1T3B]